MLSNVKTAIDSGTLPLNVAAVVIAVSLSSVIFKSNAGYTP